MQSHCPTFAEMHGPLRRDPAHRGGGEVRSPFAPDSRLRWWIAYRWIDSEKKCWASIVSWVLYGDYFRDAFHAGAFDMTMCHQDANRVGVCYCGKLREAAQGATSDES